MALVATAAVAVPAASAPPADAQVQVWYAQVTHINDGDTFEVAWNQGDDAPPGLGQPNRIRVLGVDTNEVSSSQCFADAAETFTESLIPIGTVVRLEARNELSEAGGRPLRHVFFGPNHERDLALELVEAGLGLAASYDIEPDYRDDYYEAGEQAYLDGVGMWAEGACGGNPASWPEIDVTVNYDAAGADDGNLNDEYIQIRNEGPGTLDMTGWSFRSSARSSGEQKMIPNGTTIPDGGKLRIHMGSGTDTATDIYIGETSPWLANDDDVIYIRDADLNIRYFQRWPCTVTCRPQHAVIVEEVQYDAPGSDTTNPNGEWVRIRNIGNGSVDLTDWKLQDNGEDYHFADGETLAEGEALEIRVGSGSDSGDVRYWGRSAGILANGGDALRVFTDHHEEVDCFSWGSVDCGDENVLGSIQITANYNAAGNDSTNPNGEWVAVENTGDENVDLTGYRVYTPGHSYTFPSGTVLTPGFRVRLRVGSGSDTAYNLYWGKPSGILANGGDYVQLRSPENEPLIEHAWPCGGSCGPEHSLVIHAVRYDAAGSDAANPNGEWIQIRNAGYQTTNLRDWKIKVGKKQFVETGNHKLSPGEIVRIRIGDGTDTSSTLYWGRSSGILRNSGHTVKLYTPHRQLVDCHGWGSRSCGASKQGVAAAVDVSINWDAAGDDAANPNGEWVNLANHSSSDVRLDGYELYSDGKTYVFDSGDVIPSGHRMRVYNGSGNDAGLERYAANDMDAFANDADEIVLRATDRDVMVDFSYSCGSKCPKAGNLVISSVKYDADGDDSVNPNGEWIKIRNDGSKPVDLRDWRVKYKIGTFYDFHDSLILDGGDTVRIRMGTGTDTSATVYWGLSSGLLSNSSGDLYLQTPHRALADHYDW